MTWVLFLLSCSGPDGKGHSAGDKDSADGSGPLDDSGTDDTATSSPSWPKGALILDGARVVDAVAVREDAAVVIAGDLVWDVVDAQLDWPSDATVVQLDGATVIPGLIDSHTHIFNSGTTWWVGDTLADNLAAQLAWGVVGIADMGAPEEIYDLRDRIASGEILGPRIYATGPFLTAELSHPCESYDDRALCRYVDGDGAAAVGELAASDAIKVAFADADFTPWPTPRLAVEDLVDIVDAAGSKPVWAHIDEPDDATDALEAGVSVLAHPVFSTELSEAPDAATTSTVAAFSGVVDLVDGVLLDQDLSQTPAAVVDAWQILEDNPSLFTEGYVDLSREWADNARANLSLAISQGKPVLAGSDAGYWFVPHGLGLHRELVELVEAGMTPQQALSAATLDAATLLGFEDLGLVAAGYRADLVVVSGQPDVDITATQQIERVYLAGQLHEGSDLWKGEGDGHFCLDDRDCDGRCDLVDHVCAEPCSEPYDRKGSCDADTWCMPQDGVDSTVEGVCHPGHGCDLYTQDCAPASYGENCVPNDLDTTSCWPSGTRKPPQTCSWTDPDLYCEQGAYCSWVDSRCYKLCDPADPICPGCTVQQIEGEDWFGLCL